MNDEIGLKVNIGSEPKSALQFPSVKSLPDVLKPSLRPVHSKGLSALQVMNMNRAMRRKLGRLNHIKIPGIDQTKKIDDEKVL